MARSSSAMATSLRAALVLCAGIMARLTGLPAPSGYRDSIANDLSDDSGIIVRYLAGSLVGLPETSAIWTAQTTECQRSITFDNKVFPFLRTTAADSKRMFCADGNVYASLIRDN